MSEDNIVEALRFAADQATAALEMKDHPLGGKVLLIPNGYHTEHLRPAYIQSPYIDANPCFTEAESFIHYVNEFKLGDQTHLFAAQGQNQIVAVVDYHTPGKSQPNEHYATLLLEHSPEWKAWTELAKMGTVPQVFFAEFIEEHLRDILNPSGAELLEMVTNFQSTTTVEFQQKVNISNGRIHLTYHEKDASGAEKASVPQRLELALAVYKGEPRDKLNALLRTRIKDGKLYFVVKLEQVEEIQRAAFTEVRTKVGEATGIKVLAGSP